ncbi:hypothetical protein OHR68_00360 [Spirillospora sp. NBC_00431]
MKRQLTLTGAPLVAMALLAPSPASASLASPTPLAHDYRGLYGGQARAQNRLSDVLVGIENAKRLPPSPSATSAAASHAVTVDVLDRHGRPPKTADAEYVYFRSLDGKEDVYGDLKDGHFTGRLAPGEYIVLTGVYTAEPDGAKSLSVVYLSRVVFDRDRSLVLDARKARPISVKVDRPDARLVGGEGGGAVARIVQTIGGEVERVGEMLVTDDDPVHVTPSGPAPGLKLLVQGRLTKNGAVMDSPYIYNVAGSVSGKDIIPADPTLRVRTADLAEVKTNYARQGRPACAGTHAGAILSGGGFNTGFFAGIGALPATRTEYFSPKFDWETDAGIGPGDCEFDEMISTNSGVENFPRAGVHTRDRTTGPFGPGPDYNYLLNDGTFRLMVPMFTSWHLPEGLAPADRTTLQDATGKVIGTSDEAGWGEFRLPPGRGTYKLTADAHHQVAWSDLSTRQHAVWTFTAQPPAADEPADVPLLIVRHRVRLDDDNGAPRGSQTIDLEGRAGNGKPNPAIRELALQVSYDDGATWANAPVSRTPDGWRATVRNPKGSKARHVSLRTIAEDTTGRTVDQTVIHAYALHD